MRIGIIAPSSPCGQVELELGVERLARDGFDVIVHPQCARRHFTFAGTDDERAGALCELAYDGDIDAIWCARGGYGAARLLPMLETMTAERGVPPRDFAGRHDNVIPDLAPEGHAGIGHAVFAAVHQGHQPAAGRARQPGVRARSLPR